MRRPTGRHFARNFRHPSLLGAGLVGLVACATVAALVRVDDRPRPEARIAQITHAVSGDRVTIDVSVDRSGATVDARAWWLLAEPGDDQPWVSPAYRSETLDLELEEGVSEIRWDDPLPLPGTYQLSVWVHTGDTSLADPTVYAHAAGRFVRELVQVQPGGLGRRTPPAGDVRIVDVVRRSNDQPGSYQVQVVNDSAQPQPLLLDWGRYADDVRDQALSGTLAAHAAPGSSSISLDTGTEPIPAIWLRLRAATTLVFLDEVVSD